MFERKYELKQDLKTILNFYLNLLRVPGFNKEFANKRATSISKKWPYFFIRKPLSVSGYVLSICWNSSCFLLSLSVMIHVVDLYSCDWFLNWYPKTLKEKLKAFRLWLNMMLYSIHRERFQFYLVHLQGNGFSYNKWIHSNTSSQKTLNG